MNHHDFILQLKDISYRVKSGDYDLHILKKIKLDVVRSSSTAIIGRSGSGKTSMLNIMAGLALPTSGDVFINDVNIAKLDEDQRASLRSDSIAFIFQLFMLLPNLTALENVMLPLEIKGADDAKSIAEQSLKDVGLSERANHYPNQLSGGEQQRVGIARAFSVSPELLFADEPTANLDKQNATHVEELLFALSEQKGTTLIIATHDESLASRCGRRCLVDSGVLECL